MPSPRISSPPPKPSLSASFASGASAALAACLAVGRDDAALAAREDDRLLRRRAQRSRTRRRRRRPAPAAGAPPVCLPTRPTILPNAASARASSVELITSAPSSVAMSAPRTNTPTSPIQEKTSCSRSRPVACLTCAATAAPPIAPANVENSDLRRLAELRRRERGPGVAGQLADQLAAAADHSAARLRNGPSGTPVSDRVERHAVAVGRERAGDRPELVEREDRLELLEVLRRLGILLQRGVDAAAWRRGSSGRAGPPRGRRSRPCSGRRRRACRRLRVSAVRLNASSVPTTTKSSIDAGRRRPRRRPCSRRRRASGARRWPRRVFSNLRERGLRRLGVLRRHDHREARLVGLRGSSPRRRRPRRATARSPSPSVSPSPSSASSLSISSRSFAGGIVGAHDLAGRRERVLAPVALGLDRGLDVERRRRRERATPGRPHPPEPDSPHAAAVSARTAQVSDERGGAEHVSSPFEFLSGPLCTSIGGRASQA